MDTETGLLSAARNMNKDALVKIFDLYSRALYNYALRLCDDPIIADYIVGDVFAKLLEQLSIGHGPSTNLRSYLYETTYHLVVDDARYSHRGVPLETIDSPQYDRFSIHVNFDHGMMYENVLYAMRNDLTTDQRHVIVLRFLEGFSLRETAVILGKNVANVKVIQNRAIAALRKVLGYVVAYE
jgi:RNA polymerase sigma-70 factor (ECF subfamily)